MWSSNILSTSLILALTISTLHVQNVNSANILGIFTCHSPSHLIIHMSVAKALAERGHNVTVVTSQKPKVDHESITKIIVPPSEEQELILNSQVTDMLSKKNTSSIITSITDMFGFMKAIVDVQANILKDKSFTALYESADTKFDLVILGYFLNDFELGVAAKFKCPVIVSWMSPPITIINNYVGNPEEIAYVPTFTTAAKVGEAMGFLQRLMNFLTGLVLQILSLFINISMQSYYSELFPNNGNFPSLAEMRKNVSLVFCSNHFSEGPVRPNVPALIEIGGIQIKNKPDPLPQDLAEFLAASEQNGAILFSLGSNLKSTHIKPEIMQAVYEVLSSLKQNVIWKWEDMKNIPGTAKNIMYKKWLPQDDILAHANLKLFITHAGRGGTTESQYHGVPMVALPILGDQKSNAEKMVLNGYGKVLDLLMLNGTEFKETLLEVLNNPVYTKNVKKFSQLYRDRPMTAKESAVFWTEYVLRHHGAPHMQSPLKHLNSLQSLSIDVIAFLCLFLYVVWRLIKLVVCFVGRKLFSKDLKYKKVKKH